MLGGQFNIYKIFTKKLMFHCLGVNRVRCW
ncbi:hypothetical protein DM77_1629 [Burkholderia mallei]|nr:hypothetical protein DM75_1762 [Burkholderia mallei]KOS89573.1 hypothetical protein DM53_3523 [Burkholderia mallei]KOT08020.1 hypothetical protein DM77_1629 [Burkholderia mallei]